MTDVLLGSQWEEATDFIGFWGVTGTVTYVLGTYCNGLYNAIGKTYLSFIAQITLLVVLIPAVVISAPLGFVILTFVRSATRLVIVFVQLILMWLTFQVTPLESLRQIAKPMVLSVIMIAVSICLRQISDGVLWTLLCVCMSMGTYFLASRLLFCGELTRSLDVLGLNFLKKLKCK